MQWHDDFYSALVSKFGQDNTRLIAGEAHLYH